MHLLMLTAHICLIWFSFLRVCRMALASVSLPSCCVELIMERPETRRVKTISRTEARLEAPRGRMLPALVPTTEQVPTPVPSTKKVQKDEVIFPRLFNKYICYLLLHNKLLRTDYKLPLRAQKDTHLLPRSLWIRNTGTSYLGSLLQGRQQAAVKVSATGAASHLKAQWGKDPLPSSLTCLLAGFSPWVIVCQKPSLVPCTWPKMWSLASLRRKSSRKMKVTLLHNDVMEATSPLPYSIE